MQLFFFLHKATSGEVLRVFTEWIRCYCRSADWFWQIAPVSAFTKFLACKGRQECCHRCLSSELYYGGAT